MTRIINRPVEVVMGPGGAPIRFRLGGEHLTVREVLDSWRETGRWWEQESSTETYRVSTAAGGIYELTFQSKFRRWYLYKAYD